MALVGKTMVPVCSIFSVVLVTAGIIFYMSTSPRFDINRVGVRGNSRLLPETIVEHLGIPPHTNIFRISLDEIRQQVQTLQWVKEAEVFRNFPDKISITLTEREPIALLKLDELYLVDCEGVILGALASGSAIQLPIITGNFLEDIAPDSKHAPLREALEAIDAIMQSGLPVVQQVRKIRIDCLENVTFMGFEPSPEFRISLRDYQQSLQRLERIYADLDVEHLRYLDLRFDRRIIINANKS